MHVQKIRSLLHNLTRANVFTKLDVNSGFWQIPLFPESALPFVCYHFTYVRGSEWAFWYCAPDGRHHSPRNNMRRASRASVTCSTAYGQPGHDPELREVYVCPVEFIEHVIDSQGIKRTRSPPLFNFQFQWRSATSVVSSSWSTSNPNVAEITQRELLVKENIWVNVAGQFC